MTEVADNVKKSNAEVVVFVGTNHGKLIDTLDRHTAVFRLPLVTITMDDISDSIDLRLDTNILIIEQNDNSDDYQLKEVYSIKNGPKIKRVIGTWLPRAGLSVQTLNVYERRQNLGGIQLRDALLPYAKITKPYYDQYKNVIRTGGAFQGDKFLNSLLICHHVLTMIYCCIFIQKQLICRLFHTSFHRRFVNICRRCSISQWSRELLMIINGDHWQRMARHGMEWF